MSLYPTLEDMEVSKMQTAQQPNVPMPQYSAVPSAPQYPSVGAGTTQPPAYDLSSYTFSGQQNGGADNRVSIYPSVGSEYLGFSLVSYSSGDNQVANQTWSTQRPMSNVSNVVTAPVSGVNIAGIKRSAIQPGISEVILCHDYKQQVGIRVKELNKGVFVQFVAEDSPAAIAGVRFGDQILSINDELVAGYSADKVHKLIKKSGPNNIRMAMRDRPHERIITLTKDSSGRSGFGFTNGKIVSIVKDSSAARNGVITENQIVEVNGRNVIGLKDKEIGRYMDESEGGVMTITIMPSEIYDLMIKKIGGSLLKMMDHSEPSC